MNVAFRLVSCLFLLAAASLARAAEPPAAVPAPDLAKGQALSAGVCAACHSSDGSRGSPANPILQGQHADYLVKQLVEYKEGKRDNPVMKAIAASLAVTDMRNVSAFYAAKQAKPGFAKTKATVALGEKIFRGGIADRSVPACSGCHGPGGAGIPAQYPRLAGQHADYNETQLLAFRSGARRNSAVMTDVAAKMNDREIKAVSDYLAGLR